MAEDTQTTVGTKVSPEGIVLVVGLNHATTMNIPLAPDEADKLARELIRACKEWDRLKGTAR